MAHAIARLAKIVLSPWAFHFFLISTWKWRSLERNHIQPALYQFHHLNYANVEGLSEHGYLRMTPVEEILASIEGSCPLWRFLPCHLTPYLHRKRAERCDATKYNITHYNQWCGLHWIWHCATWWIPDSKHMPRSIYDKLQAIAVLLIGRRNGFAMVTLSCPM